MSMHFRENARGTPGRARIAPFNVARLSRIPRIGTRESKIRGATPNGGEMNRSGEAPRKITWNFDGNFCCSRKRRDYRQREIARVRVIGAVASKTAITDGRDIKSK